MHPHRLRGDSSPSPKTTRGSQAVAVAAIHLDAAANGASALPHQRHARLQRVRDDASTTRTPSQWRRLPTSLRQDPRRSVVVEDHEVDVAVVVEVAGGEAAADVQRRERRAGAGGHVHESTPAIVAKQLIALAQRIGVALLRPGCSDAAPRR